MRINRIAQLLMSLREAAKLNPTRVEALRSKYEPIMGSILYNQIVKECTEKEIGEYFEYILRQTVEIIKAKTSTLPEGTQVSISPTKGLQIIVSQEMWDKNAYVAGALPDRVLTEIDSAVSSLIRNLMYYQQAHTKRDPRIEKKLQTWDINKLTPEQLEEVKSRYPHPMRKRELFLDKQPPHTQILKEETDHNDVDWKVVQIDVAWGNIPGELKKVYDSAPESLKSHISVTSKLMTVAVPSWRARRDGESPEVQNQVQQQVQELNVWLQEVAHAGCYVKPNNPNDITTYYIYTPTYIGAMQTCKIYSDNGITKGETGAIDWCTSDFHHSSNYLSGSPLTIVLKDGAPVAQYHAGNDEFKDISNEDLTDSNILDSEDIEIIQGLVSDVTDYSPKDSQDAIDARNNEIWGTISRLWDRRGPGKMDFDGNEALENSGAASWIVAYISVDSSGDLESLAGDLPEHLKDAVDLDDIDNAFFKHDKDQLDEDLLERILKEGELGTRSDRDLALQYIAGYRPKEEGGEPSEDDEEGPTADEIVSAFNDIGDEMYNDLEAAARNISHEEQATEEFNDWIDSVESAISDQSVYDLNRAFQNQPESAYGGYDGVIGMIEEESYRIEE